MAKSLLPALRRKTKNQKKNQFKNKITMSKMTICYITKKDSETGVKFQELEQKMNQVRKEQEKLSDELGFSKWRDDPWAFAGGFSSLLFDKKPNDKLYRKKVIFPNEFVPRRNSKEGKLISEKLKACPKVEKGEANACVNFDGHPFKSIGFAFDHDEYFGFQVDSSWNFTPPADCEEITPTKYKELFYAKENK
jgi:hypothetical protein